MNFDFSCFFLVYWIRHQVFDPLPLNENTSKNDIIKENIEKQKGWPLAIIPSKDVSLYFINKM